MILMQLLILIMTRDSDKHSATLDHLERNPACVVATMMDHLHDCIALGKPLSTFSNHEHYMQLSWLIVHSISMFTIQVY